MKYIFVPFGVAVSARILVDKVLQPQPKDKEKTVQYKPFKVTPHH